MSGILAGGPSPERWGTSKCMPNHPNRRNLRRTSALVVWLYTGLLALWFVSHLLLGDRVWWLAVVNTFAPYLFLPLVFLVPLSLAKPGYCFRGAILLSALIFVWEYGQLFDFWPLGSGGVEERSITIMSFNIWGYSESVETAQAILSAGIPDVVVLQELSPDMARILIEELGEVYPYRLLEPAEGAEGRGILSRYPLKDLSTSASSWLDSFAQVAEAETGNGTFTLYNVHLAPTMVFYYLEINESIAAGVCSSIEAREQQMSQLVADVARRRGPVVVAGDLNTTDQSDAYSILTRYLKDAHRKAGRGFGHTFPAYAGSFRGIPIIPRTARVDMILYSPEFLALNSRVGRDHGESDHLPVLAKLAWAQ